MSATIDAAVQVMRPFGRKSHTFITRHPSLDRKYTILVGSVRSSKTFTVDAKTIVQYSQYEVPGKRFIAGLSKDSVHRNMLLDLFAVVGQSNYSYNMASGELWLFDKQYFVVGAKDEASYILGIAGIYELPKPEKNGLYKGKDVFSMLLPKDLNFETKISGGTLKIVDGKLIDGVITKETYGKGNNKLLIKIGMDYGYEALKDFLYVSSKLADAYVTFAGITVGVKEYTTNEEIEKARLALLDNTFKLVDEKIHQYRAGKLEPLIGYTRRESLERMIIVDLNIARDKAGEVLIKYVDPANFAMQMARAGSRGSIFQYEQMSMFLGQQATLSGGRIKRGYYTRRVLPHIREGDVGPSARGFVRTNYEMGLSPIDLFMHAVGSRGSEVYKALLTARSGYLYRRLSNALQDLYVERDFSVRDTSNNIVQTMYGGDGIEPVTVQFAKLSKAEKKG